MAFLWLLTTALACEIPQLPERLHAFEADASPSVIDVSSAFLLVDVEWTFEAKTHSWLRIALEPHLADLSLRLLNEEYVVQSGSHFAKVVEMLPGVHFISIKYSEVQDES